jgi:hypothetical protein
MTMKKPFVFLALATFLTGLPASAQSLVDLRLKSVATWAENISRSSSPLDWADAMTYEVAVGADHRRQLTSSLTGLFQVEAGALYRPDYRQNDELNFGPRAELRQKFGLGAFAPVLAAEASFIGKSARMSGNDGWTAKGGLTLSKRLTESWRIAATGDWHNHYADRATFDVRYQRLFGELTWTSPVAGSSPTATVASGVTSPPTPLPSSGPAPSAACSVRPSPATITPCLGK